MKRGAAAGKAVTETSTATGNHDRTGRVLIAAARGTMTTIHYEECHADEGAE
jgi:hypothetical protein